jgi:hypothetical protein
MLLIETERWWMKHGIAGWTKEMMMALAAAMTTREIYVIE